MYFSFLISCFQSKVDRDQKFDNLFMSGQQLVQEEKFAAAYHAFEQAYVFKQDNDCIYYMGLCQQAAGNLPSACYFFELYVRNGTDILGGAKMLTECRGLLIQLGTEHLMQAEELFEDKKYNEAIPVLTMALSLFPNCDDARGPIARAEYLRSSIEWDRIELTIQSSIHNAKKITDIEAREKELLSLQTMLMKYQPHFSQDEQDLLREVEELYTEVKRAVDKKHNVELQKGINVGLLALIDHAHNHDNYKIEEILKELHAQCEEITNSEDVKDQGYIAPEIFLDSLVALVRFMANEKKAKDEASEAQSEMAARIADKVYEEHPTIIDTNLMNIRSAIRHVIVECWDRLEHPLPVHSLLESNITECVNKVIENDTAAAKKHVLKSCGAPVKDRARFEHLTKELGLCERKYLGTAPPAKPDPEIDLPILAVLKANETRRAAKPSVLAPA